MQPSNVPYTEEEGLLPPATALLQPPLIAHLAAPAKSPSPEGREKAEKAKATKSEKPSDLARSRIFVRIQEMPRRPFPDKILRFASELAQLPAPASSSRTRVLNSRRHTGIVEQEHSVLHRELATPIARPESK